MKLFLTTLLLIVTAVGFAQQQNIYFVKNNGRIVKERDSADYTRVITEPDSGSTYYKVNEYYPNEKTKFIGKSSTIQPLVFEGQCAAFYANGKKRFLRNYKHGALINRGYEFFPNGQIYTERQYLEQDKNGPIKYALIIASFDSLGVPMVVDSNGYHRSYSADFKSVYEEGPIKKGKRDGEWKGWFDIMKLRFTETYEDGRFIMGTSFDSTGDAKTYTGSKNAAPMFQGGNESLMKYLASAIRYPKNAREKHIQGEVVISFLVDIDGKLSHFRVVKFAAPELTREALRVVMHSPKWIPGTQFGRKIKAYYSLPINFALSPE